MALIIIEGDNGTGKTTIGQKFSEKEYFVVTDDATAKECETSAKTFQIGSRVRFDAFVKYNDFCGKLAKEHNNSLIVRYWISTVAAGYADGCFSMPEALMIATNLYKKLPEPDYVFRLKCDYGVRISRINARNSIVPDATDDITIERDKKYQEILDELEKIVNNWFTINTADQSPEQIFEVMIGIIKK
jgi:thymidylate kinase